MLTLISESAAQVNLPLVTIDPGTIVNEANQKAAEIKARAEENIERDKQRAVNDIKDEISDIVIMAASKVVEKEISAKDNEAIIADFLQNVGTAK